MRLLGTALFAIAALGVAAMLQAREPDRRWWL